MAEAFVVMQIGNDKMDRVWKDVYKPTIEKNGLTPIRIDKHDDGTLLKQQIIRFLADSHLVVADLTNERPNCYLEVGYVMGLNGYDRLILCCREDHNPDSPNHSKGGPKVHFDLTGYGILWWNPNQFEDFSRTLEARMKQRLKQPQTTTQYATAKPTTIEEASDWIGTEREKAFGWLKKQ